MNRILLNRLLESLRHAWGHAEGGDRPSAPGRDGVFSGYTASPWSHLWGRSPELLNVEDEVAGERQGRLVVYSQQGALCSTLLGRLRQQPPTPITGVIAREGFFTLVDLSTTGPRPGDQQPHTGEGAADEGWASAWEWSDRWASPMDAADLMAETGAGADLLLFLFAAEAGWQESDARWFARLRALSAPVLPVMMVTSPAGTDETLLSHVRQQLGVRPVMVMCADPTTCSPTADGSEPNAPTTPATPPQDLLGLVERMLALRPRLALALAQEAPACRRLIAQRVIRTGALVTALVGSEPIPLLDLPLHVAMNWRVALQLATIYGRPGLDYRSREMVGAVTLNLAVRYLAQQALKLLPLFGWLLSGALSGVSTFLLGHTLLRYYEEERLWPTAPPVWRVTWWLGGLRLRWRRRKTP
ncbi:MAG: hypothetical protein DCC57_02665 [Chloroflexi bacterium]|nr:MAG: hypothetical protein DCC57_02665 [Chloroflexota bacterium]